MTDEVTIVDPDVLEGLRIGLLQDDKEEPDEDPDAVTAPDVRNDPVYE